MQKKIFRLVVLFALISIAIASLICAVIFNTSFAKNTIDYFSFFAASFLMVDGLFKIWRYREEPYFPNHFVRNLRIIIGACVFTIHVMQYIYGV
jgi:peptidoglycan/LPS O-acetylase OafA/YrhL